MFNTARMDYTVARKRMVEGQLVGRGIQDSRVIEVMGRVPRQEFIDPGIALQAYEDRPLNIGFKQTISQPYMVALMTEALRLTGPEKVLEIGTGCGYQTAVLCELAKHVYSIERLRELSNRARKTLYRLGYFNFDLRIGDGSLGWAEAAPFDAICVTAAAREVPAPYREQLGEGGRLVIPIGGEESQELIRVTRRKRRFEEEAVTGCRFVKLIGQYGWSDEGQES